MISIRSSRATSSSTSFKSSPRLPRETNLTWLARTRAERSHPTTLVLLGGRGTADVRVRMAQSHARDDLTPSHWSHILLSVDPALEAGYEVPLCRPWAGSFPPASNGVQEVALKAYRDARAYPNLAVVSVPAPADEVLEVLARFQKERAGLDAVELMVLWLGFVWGVGRASNPLVDGQGLPSAAMVEYVLGAVGLDLTPGLGSRASCPEAIWQSARWWHPYHEREGGPALTGAWTIGHILVE